MAVSAWSYMTGGGGEELRLVNGVFGGAWGVLEEERRRRMTGIIGD